MAGIFSDKERKQIRSKGGVMEVKAKEDITKAEEMHDILDNITDGGSKGFIFAMQKDGKNTEGIARVNGMSKEEVLSTVIKALNIPFKVAVAELLLATNLKDDD